MSNIPKEYIISHFSHLIDIDELKAGGQKAVYTIDSSLYENAVLKICLREGEDERALREIAIVKNNNFPNVPKIYEYGTLEHNSKEYLYMFEEKVTGSDLRTELCMNKKQPLMIVINFMSDLISTVVELEKKNIVHRDIKPDNILLDINGKFWLIDFGIARDIAQISLTATSANFGPHTAGYAPPEQYRNMKSQIDSRTDLFSIGVVAYEMLHGFNPFIKNANSIIDVYMKTETLTEKPLMIDGDPNGELAGFLTTLMQKNHTYRPPTAEVALSWLNEIKSTLETGE